MHIEVLEALNRRQLREFLRFPYRLYRDDPNWVAPLRRDQRRLIFQRRTPLLRTNPHTFLLARVDNLTVARICVTLQRQAGTAFFTWLESIKNFDVFRTMLTAAENWACERSATLLRGPVSPTLGYDYRGLLVEGFTHRPLFMDSYNASYYPEYLSHCGFMPFTDLMAYRYDLAKIDFVSRMRAVHYAMKRYGFSIDHLHHKDYRLVAHEVQAMLGQALAGERTAFPFSNTDILGIARRIKDYADRDLIIFARDQAGEPIGFLIALPDYNQLLNGLSGRLGLRGRFRLVFRRNQIQCARSFFIFVVPAYRRKGVAQGIYLTAFNNAYHKGYTHGEASDISADNLVMRRDAEKLGGRHYKTYRIYQKFLNPGSGE